MKWLLGPENDIIERRVWGYQRGNQNPYIEEEQTTQWSKEKIQKDKQWSTKHTYKTKDWKSGSGMGQSSHHYVVVLNQLMRSQTPSW